MSLTFSVFKNSMPSMFFSFLQEPNQYAQVVGRASAKEGANTALVISDLCKSHQAGKLVPRFNLFSFVPSVSFSSYLNVSVFVASSNTAYGVFSAKALLVPMPSRNTIRSINLIANPCITFFLKVKFFIFKYLLLIKSEVIDVRSTSIHPQIYQ